MQALRATYTDTLKPALLNCLTRLKFIDEIGVHIGLTRLYGRAEPGVRVSEGTPGRSGTHYTVIAALGWSGPSEPLLIAGSMDRLVLDAYVEHELAPRLLAGDIVIWDNLSVHQSERARQLIEARGARLQFLPPYSPDMNPIELCWSKIKTALRAAKARTLDALLDALATALRSVTPADAQAWFAHCGYTLA